MATWRFRIAKIVLFQYPRWPTWQPSWNSFDDISSQTYVRFSCGYPRYRLLNPKSDLAETWWEACQWHKDSKLLKSFHSDIQDGCLGCHIVAIMKFIKQHLLLNPKSHWAETWWEASQWHRDSELLKLFHSDIQDGRLGCHIVAIMKFIKQHLLNPKSHWAETWWEASQWHRDSELLKLFHSDIQDGHWYILQKSDWAEMMGGFGEL